jgi:glycosyltransferase involved in cell wall biosynthesis
VPSRGPTVLHVVLSLNPGGTERLVTQLVMRLQLTSPTAVCCLDQMGRWGEELAREGIPVQALQRQPGFRPALGAGIARVAAQAGAHVLHCHQYSPFVYAVLARARHPGLRLVFTEHGRLSDAPPSTKRKLVNPLLARGAHRIFSVSQDLRRHMIAEGLPASRIEVITNGVDPEPRSDSARAELRGALGVTASTVVLITVARLDPVKDLATLVAATEGAAREAVDLHLVVVGDGPERPALEAQTSSLRLASRVTFLGHREDARRWLSAADVYVSSSVSEGISLTILEGMSAGLPVIATAVGGTPEIVDASCALLVPSRDPAALTRAMVALARDPDRRRRLGEAARARVLASFTIDRMVASYRQVYEEVC